MQSSLFSQKDFIHAYHSHQSWVYSWLCKKLGSTQDASDLTQDTFVKLLQKTEQISIAEPRAYLTTIAHGLMVNHLRRRDIERALNLALSLHNQENISACPETYFLMLEKLITIDAMLDGLPANVREAFLLHKLDGLGYAEIAENMRLSVSSIKKYIAKALLHCAST